MLPYKVERQYPDSRHFQLCSKVQMPPGWHFVLSNIQHVQGPYTEARLFAEARLIAIE